MSQKALVKEVVEDVKSVYVDLRRNEDSAIRNLICGGLAGGLSRTIVAPLSIMKSISQLSPTHVSMGDTAVQIFRAGGARTFWLGSVPALIRIVPHSGIKFMLYQSVFGHLTRPDPGGSAAQSTSLYRKRFTSGALSGAFATILLYPLDVLKSRVTLFKYSHLAAQKEVPSFAWLAAAKELHDRGGWAGATRGIGVSVIGSSLHNGLLFMGYYSARSWWLPPSQGRNEENGRIFPFLACGAMAAFLGQATYPFDLIRRTALHNGLHAMDTAHLLIQSGGLLGLYRGSVANLFKVVPLYAVQFCAYEILLRNI